jgi:1,4-dihydroxy-2-naphthoate octaprenyltransferase
MSAVEPTAERLTNPVVRYFLATRPPFLTASLVPCLIGLATAFHDGVAIDAATAVFTVLGALLVHAGVNVLNDYYDALNGTDALNTDRIFPFTGGSRFIQNGVLTSGETARYGVALFVCGAAIGVWLAFASGPGLWWIGAFGLLLGWAYSAPPFNLNSRGFGELSVAIGFGVLIPLGADYVQRGALDVLPLLAGLPFALLVANLLYINQFPDRRADEAAGKRHWVVRLGARRARWGYVTLVVLAYAILLAEVAFGVLPMLAAIAALPAVFSFSAAAQLLRYAETPARLAPAIQQTILAMLAHGVLLSAALVWG